MGLRTKVKRGRRRRRRRVDRPPSRDVLGSLRFVDSGCDVPRSSSLPSELGGPGPGVIRDGVVERTTVSVVTEKPP